MIITENIKINDNDFTRKYSDENRYLVDNDGNEYSEAIDLVIYPKEYTEGRPIEEDEPEEETSEE